MHIVSLYRTQVEGIFRRHVKSSNYEKPLKLKKPIKPNLTTLSGAMHSIPDACGGLYVRNRLS